MNPFEETPSCKIILLGNCGVGKTNIIGRYMYNTFGKDYVSSSGVSFTHKTIEYKKLKKCLSLDIWDTAGQEKYRSLTKLFYKDASVVILVYDITNKLSFQDIENVWYPLLKENINHEYILAVAANKFDLFDIDDVVSEEDGKQLADKLGALYFQVSACKGLNIKELFENSGQAYITKVLLKNEAPKRDGKKLEANDISEPKKKKCC